MTKSVALVIALVCFLIPAAAAVATDATGYALPGCPMSDDRIHLTHFPEQKRGQELVFSVRSFYCKGVAAGYKWESDNWENIEAELCSASGRNSCENVPKAAIQVLRCPYSRLLRRSRMMGNFKIALADGKTISGSFNVKYRKVPGMRCE